MDRQSFEGLVGSSFKVSPQTGGTNPVWLRLSTVSDLPSLAPVNPASMAVPPKQTSPAPTTSGYLVNFSGPGTSLAQGTYIFENDRMGSFRLFIVPGLHGSYTAVFNLLNAQPGRHLVITSQENGSPERSSPATAPGRPAVVETLDRSSASSPAQELVEPLLRGGFKTKLPE